MSMFCYQCQETAMGTGCTLKGVCGKTSEVANLQDLLLFVVRGIAVYNEHLRRERHPSEEADKFIYDALFITITNANFDKTAIIRKIKEGLQLKNELASKVTIANAPDECLWDGSEDEFEEKARTVGVLRTPDEDIRSLKELVHYGLKGMAAYVEHAHNLGYQSPEIFAFMQSALAELTRNDITMEELVQLTLATGKHGVSAMAQLDAANTNSYGNPEISEVNLGVRNNPGILISGHDLKDLEELLEQTEGTGIDIYTHSEMLPAHYYPQLKNTSIWQETTEMPGGNRKKSLKVSTDRSCLPVTASFLRVPTLLTKTVSTSPEPADWREHTTSPNAKTENRKISPH